MATTSAAVARGGGRGVRASISGFQFTEAAVARGGGRAPGAKIGSKTTVLNVKSWTPDQDDEEVPHGHSVELNIEALNSELLDVHYAEGTDFLSGTLDDVEVIGDALNLVTSPITDDFESYTVGQNPVGNGWTLKTVDGGWSIRADAADSVQQLRHLDYNKRSTIELDAGPDVSDFDMKARFRFTASGGGAYLSGRMTGSGTALRGYVGGIREGTYWFYFGRHIGSGLLSGIAINWDIGFTPTTDTWYWVRWRAVGTVHYFKTWEDGTAEPAGWHGKSDTVHPGPGTVGLYGLSSTANQIKYFDDFSVETIPAVYQTSGSWEESVDVSSVDHFSHGQVSWDETTPANTTAAVKYRWRSTDSWAALNNGEVIPGIDYEQDMRPGATRDTLEFRVELATTDTGVTPAVSNLRVYFEPARDEAFEVAVHGEASVIADLSLVVWGRSFLSAGVGDPYLEAADWSDLYLLTRRRWMARDEQTVTAAFEYWGNAIDSVTFEAEPSKYRHGYGRSYWTMPITPIASGPTIYEWTALKEWFAIGHNYEWNLVDKGQAIHGDARWLVGHYQIDNFPGSVLPALVNISNFPGSLLVKGWRLDDFPGSLLIQGWRFDNFPGSVLAAIRYERNFPGSVLVAVAHHANFPGSVLVFGVNREGSIELNVIDDSTWAALSGEGIGVDE